MVSHKWKRIPGEGQEVSNFPNSEAGMSGLHSRLNRANEKNQANMMRKKSESYHSLSLRDKVTTIKRPKERNELL